MSKFLVKIKITDDDNHVFHEFHIVNRKQLDVIENLDISREGGCCGQSRCLTCRLGGITAKYVDHIKLIKKESAVAKLIADSAYYDYDDLVEDLDSESDSDDN